MASRMSRRKIARYYAESLLSGKDSNRLAQQLAAYLVDSGNVKELNLIISDIEYQLSLNGVVVVDVVSVYDLNELTKSAIIDLTSRVTKATQIQLREHLDSSVLGGVRLGFSGFELDATIARRLATLKTNCNK